MGWRRAAGVGKLGSGVFRAEIQEDRPEVFRSSNMSPMRYFLTVMDIKAASANRMSA